MKNALFTIPGQPQGKARARVTKFGSYTPEKTVLYENLIKLSFQERSDFYSEAPLEVSIEAVYEVPKSKSKKQAEQMLQGAIKPTKKPDIDNIAKVVLDALNGVTYKDDTQVVKLSVRKRYGGGCGHVNVFIQEAGE